MAPSSPLLRPWQLSGFRRFWLGETVSFVGNEVTALALPLTAVLVLGAGSSEMGLLTAAWFLPYLVFGLPAGIWVDRMRRQRILVGLDLLSAATVVVVPIAAALGLLRIELLYAVSFVLGSVVVVFTVAYQSFVPTLVGRAAIAEANAALEATSSGASVAGPGIGGILVQLLGAPFALVLDAASFLFSATLVASIAADEPPPIPDAERRPAMEQIREGIAYVAGSPPLAALVAGGTVHNFFSRMIDALFVLYASRQIGLDAATIGLVVAAAGPGAFLGSVLAGRARSVLGLGRTIWAAQVGTGIARLLVPLTLVAGGGIAGAAVLGASMFLLGVVRSIFNINQLSLRLSMTPDRMHGRLNATMRFVMWGVTPIGAVVGGILASTALGIEGTLVLAAIGVLAATGPFLHAGLRTLQELPSSLNRPG
jgi:predicted MFS family arabinose efflux permease